MTFRPKSNSRKELILSIIMALAAIALFTASGFVNHLIILYQISALIFAVVSIQFYLKYVASDYVYDASDDSFKVYKITGKKSICVSSLDYEMSLSVVVPSAKYLSDKQKYPKTNFNVNLCKNFAPKHYCVYFFEFNGKKSMLKFEPDEIFVNYINKKIISAWEKEADEELYEDFED